ncbi:MAG: DNA gyrase subunit A [Clostridia bacterium]|nr:DNA gyrase subunit A [Clostridia bacterium]
MDYENQKIIPVDIEKELKDAYLAYSMSVIVGRALPDVRDGLKPVHRRILYTLHESGLTPDKETRKCADIVGKVLGSYHPHGDASVYDALVRMAQDFSLRYPLVEGQGNFGSVDGHPAAAYRYTEAKMSRMSVHMLSDIDRETVDFAPNYDDRLQEPTVLPSRFPNLLVNGSSGIAVGMATNVPPHNLRETVDALVCLIDNPDATLEELMDHIKGPDFPTGGVIMGRSGIRAAYGTGRGRIILRARAEIVEEKNHSNIVITEIPYQVNKTNLVVQIANLIKDKRVEGLSSVDDYSDREGIRIVVELKRDANAQVALNHLYKNTQMQITFGAIMLALSHGIPKVMTLKEMLEEYLAFQLEVVRRRAEFDLKKAKERAHIIEALKVVIDYTDEVIAIIRSSENVAVAKERLSERFGFDDVQAQAIVSMRLGQLTSLEGIKIETEYDSLIEKIEDLSDYVVNEGRQRKTVKTEAKEIADKYGDDRRTSIEAISGEMDIEDLIEQEDCVLTLTRFGYMKRLPVDTFQSQRRGGRGVSGMTRRDEDVAEEMFMCSSHDHVMFFSNLGKVYRIKCYQIPEGSRTSKGLNAANILPIMPGEKITAMIKVPDINEEAYLCMVTRKGFIKRCDLSLFNSNRSRSGLIALDLMEGDELAWVKMTSGDENLLVATRRGKAICFNENDVRPMGRTARGVRAIKMDDGDEVVGMARMVEGGTVLTVTETGFGRRSNLSDYRVQTRGGKGLLNYRTSVYGDVAAIRVVDDSDDIIMISSNGIVIRIPVSEIATHMRPAKGVRVMRLVDDPDGEPVRLVSLTKVAHDENEIDEHEIEEDEDSGDVGAAETEEAEDNDAGED